jgi:transcriptional regulator GlxA family with amidase domain
MTDIPTSLPATEILLFDGFDDLDAIGPLEILHGAGFPVRPVGLTAPSTVPSAHGLRIALEHALSAAPELLVVPGGGWVDRAPGGVRALAETELPARLAELHAQGTVLASVCTGAMLLGRAGVLRDRPAVTNHRALDDLEEMGADVRRHARVVDDGSVVTSGGPAAGLDLALRLVERYRGPEVARRAAAELEHERVGPTVITVTASR